MHLELEGKLFAMFLEEGDNSFEPCGKVDRAFDISLPFVELTDVVEDKILELLLLLNLHVDLNRILTLLFKLCARRPDQMRHIRPSEINQSCYLDSKFVLVFLGQVIVIKLLLLLLDL